MTFFCGRWWSEPVNIFSTNSSWVEFAARRIKAGRNVSLYYNTIQYSMMLSSPSRMECPDSARQIFCITTICTTAVQCTVLPHIISYWNAHINRDGFNFKICNPTFQKNMADTHFTLQLQPSFWFPLEFLARAGWIPSNGMLFFTWSRYNSLSYCFPMHPTFKVADMLLPTRQETQSSNMSNFSWLAPIGKYHMAKNTIMYFNILEIYIYIIYLYTYP